MPKYNDPENNCRPFFASLVYTKDGDLDLTWLFVLLMGLAGVVAFLHMVFFHPQNTMTIIAGWSFLGAAFASVLIAAIPIHKAKVLAASKLPGEIANAISEVAQNVEMSTDVQEIYESQQHRANVDL